MRRKRYLEELAEDHVAYWKMDSDLWHSLQEKKGGILTVSIEEGFKLQDKKQIYARILDDHSGQVQVLTWKKLWPLWEGEKMIEFEMEVMVAPRLKAVKQEPQEGEGHTFDKLIGDADVQSQILIPGRDFSRQKTLATAGTIPALEQEFPDSSQLTQTQ